MHFYRGAFRRIVELDARIRAGRFPNCTTFAREWEVSTKTVQRDVELLRDRLLAPIEYDGRRRGYFYTDRAWKLPRLDLTEGELFQLAVCERMAAQYAGTPLAAALDSLFLKVRAVLDSSAAGIDPLDVVTGFSFHGHPVRAIDETTWRVAAESVRERRVAIVSYRRYGETTPRTHDFEPVHLACLDGEWVLVGRAAGHDDFATLALSRVVSIAPTDRAARAVTFDPRTFFANRFGRFVGKDGATHRVVVRFSPSAAEGVLERRWHREQDVRRDADGSVILSFPAPALFEVRRWVLQWGGDAEVLAPPELRDAVVAEARRIVARDQGAATSGGKTATPSAPVARRRARTTAPRRSGA